MEDERNNVNREHKDRLLKRGDTGENLKRKSRGGMFHVTDRI